MYLSKSRRGSRRNLCAHSSPILRIHVGALGVSPATMLNVPPDPTNHVAGKRSLNTLHEPFLLGEAEGAKDYARPGALQRLEDPGHLHLVFLEAEWRAKVVNRQGRGTVPSVPSAARSAVPGEPPSKKTPTSLL